MIVDSIRNADRYVSLHPDFAAAFRFLRGLSGRFPGEGRHEIEGDRIFALAAGTNGRGRPAAKLEIHRKYIDIQLILDGVDTIGWRDLKTCCRPEAAFDEKNDYQFFQDAAELWLELAPERFAIFFPEDAHAPLAGEGPVSKVVVKIAI